MVLDKAHDLLMSQATLLKDCLGSEAFPSLGPLMPQVILALSDILSGFYLGFNHIPSLNTAPEKQMRRKCETLDFKKAMTTKPIQAIPPHCLRWTLRSREVKLLAQDHITCGK